MSLGPHGADINDIVKALRPSIEDLGKGITININGQETFVRAFPIVLIGDMPQQTDNSGFLRHTARFGCRACFCPQEELGNIDFDIITKKRSHYDTVYDREFAVNELDGQARKKFFTDHGMRPEPSLII